MEIRFSRGERNPNLDELEQLVTDKIIELRISVDKVTRAFIVDSARLMASENGKTDFGTSNRWHTGFINHLGSNFVEQNFTTHNNWTRSRCHVTSSIESTNDQLVEDCFDGQNRCLL